MSSTNQCCEWNWYCSTRNSKNPTFLFAFVFFFTKVKAVEYFIDGATVSRLMKW